MFPAWRALELTLRYRGWVIVCIMLLTVPAVIILTRAEISRSIIESFVDDPEDYLAAKQLESLFQGNPDALIWLATTEDDRLGSAKTLRAVRKASRAIKNLPAVRNVVSLPDIPRPITMDSGVLGTAGRVFLNSQLRAGKVPRSDVAAEPILPWDATHVDSDIREILRRLKDESSFGSQLISTDGRSQLMLLELESPGDLLPSEQIDLVQQIRSLIESHGLGANGVYCSGLIAVQAFAFEEIAFVIRTLLPVGGLLISIAVLIVFRRLEIILLTLFIASVAVVFGLAAGIVAFGKISVLMAAVPLMVLVISTADVIHLVSSYTAERSVGHSHRQALRRTIIEVGGACVLTSLTTFVGFASLIFVPSQTVRQFGIATAAGVASALLLSVIVVPIMLDWLADSDRPVLASARASRATQFLAQWCLRFGCSFPRLTVFAFLLMLTACVAIASRVVLDPDLSRRFAATHPMTLSADFFEEQYGGASSVELLLGGDPVRLFAPSTLARIQEFASTCQDRFACGRVDSIASLLGEFLRQLDYRNTTGEPESAEHALATLEYLRQAQPELVDRLVTQDRSQLRMLIRVPVTSYLELLAISDTLTKHAEATFDEPYLQITTKGSAPVVGRAIRDIIRGHLHGCLFCFSAIFVLIAIGLRSWRVAAVSALPNLTPLLLLGGLIGLISTKADSDLLGVATLGLGLAVDDTIHFLSRYRIERRAGHSTQRALALSMDHTGLAIIRTTLILSVGFLPFAFSSYLSVNMLGTYLIAVLLAAVLADLVLLPAILRITFDRG